ncbi:MAG: insulinase family protein [Muribaculaceae bacterium]|nr:insulinase family protein [Muribaculaceae bacterium]
MKFRFLLFLSTVLFGSMALSAASVPYDTIPGDPIKTRIYTLPNGLKVFMSVNKKSPRIQTNIAVRVGGKNDPAETTGLAHYFEHLMFKGTEQFGTSDYAAEKPLLDSIEAAFETYRHTTDPATRAKIYHHIDSLSYAASLLAIPNEYDKLMAAIGADGTNAYTSMDATCYVEDIPSNQIETWARVQADRFAHPILRGFHTELETIYEEKNMSLKDDSDRLFEALFEGLFPDHPYGTQSVLGTQEHLKNPSITNVKAYHGKWYVPNNMAIAMAGDFDPDEAIEIIAKYFGSLQPNPELSRPAIAGRRDIPSPVIREVVGPESEAIYLAWRIPGKSDSTAIIAKSLGSVMTNGFSGILDRNVRIPQRTLSSGSFAYLQADAGSFIMYGQPAPGQTLDDVRDILLQQADSLRQGRFSEGLIEAVANNNKLYNESSFESNEGRTDIYVDAFTSGVPLAEALYRLTNAGSVSKSDIVDFAHEYIGPENYVAVYKRQGQDSTLMAIEKPALTPIATNRDMSSAFLDEVVATEVEPIEPRFVDYDRDLTILKDKAGSEVLYVRNTTNDIFNLSYIFETGQNASPLLANASALLKFASTPTMTAADVQRRFYELACRYGVSVGTTRTTIQLIGLSENMAAALELLTELINSATVDDATFDKWLDNVAQGRENERTNERQCYNALRSYAMYGPDNLYTKRPSVDELRSIGSKAILDELKSLMSDMQRRVLYYGPDSETQLLSMLDTHTPAHLTDPAPVQPFTVKPTDEPIIYVAPFDMPQVDFYMFSLLPEKMNLDTQVGAQLFNTYFGGGMNSIVFQEMRESRSLAYSAWASLGTTGYKPYEYIFNAGIGTQVDKLPDAMKAFEQIIEDMPLSESAFNIARQSLDKSIRTERVLDDDIAWAYIRMQDYGFSGVNKKLFSMLPTLTLDAVSDFHKRHIKGCKYRYAILGPIEKIDMPELEKRGKVVILTLDDIFGTKH